MRGLNEASISLGVNQTSSSLWTGFTTLLEGLD